MLNLAVMVSGQGTNLQAMIDAIVAKQLDCRINVVFSNKSDAYALTRARKHNIPALCYESRAAFDRSVYEERIVDSFRPFNIDIVVLAGWNFILTDTFLTAFSGRIINLHPGLPGGCVGNNGIQQAFACSQENPTRPTTTYSGAMVHYVVREVDMGNPISTIHVPIYSSDTLDSYTARLRRHEKGVLLSALRILADSDIPTRTFRKGKVRDIYEVNNKMIALVQTNRLSAFDRSICDILDKGNVLTLSSAWWFSQIENVLKYPTHYLSHYQNIMFVKKCKMIPLEVVVRAYMTGSTKTSLWTHYKGGCRNYCGNVLADGYVKNQRLPSPIITPTTKGVEDVPLSAGDILERGIVTEEAWKHISRMAMDIFEYGQRTARERNLILVDTKYEFGYDMYGNIVIADEVHTCDSSRYWDASTYQERFAAGEEPEKFDKDIIRDYIKKKYEDPYTAETLDIPEEMRETTRTEYMRFYEILTGNAFVKGYIDPVGLTLDQINVYCTQCLPSCIVLSGSVKDAKHVNTIKDELHKLGIHAIDYVSSAHKNTTQLLGILDAHTKGYIVYITVAGKSDALSGVVAANTRFPVIACPSHSDKTDMMVNINSTLQLPTDVPAMVVLNPINAAQCCARILQFR